MRSHKIFSLASLIRGSIILSKLSFLLPTATLHLPLPLLCSPLCYLPPLPIFSSSFSHVLHLRCSPMLSIFSAQLLCFTYILMRSITLASTFGQETIFPLFWAKCFFILAIPPFTTFLQSLHVTMLWFDKLQDRHISTFDCWIMKEHKM